MATAELTIHALKLNTLIEGKGYKTIEVHLISTRQALNMPPKKQERRTQNMSEAEKLQKAVELTLAAGYQLDKEAFEFLSIIMAAEDPTEVMSKAIKQLEELGQRPFFIARNFLEQVMQAERPAKEIVSEPSEIQFQSPKEQLTPQTTEGKMPYHPYAKDVDASINIIDDPSTKLSSNGTIDDYLEYFQDRFRQTEKLLRQRMDVKSAASVMDALRAQSGTRLKIIGMITEKRESKQKIILAIEDLTASITVLVPQNASTDLQKKARFLLLDQIICLSVVKTRSNLLIAEDVILPDVAQRTQHKAPVPVYAVLTSDMHVGSTKFTREAFDRFILWLNGKYGDEKSREIASHVKYVLIAGDIVDGVGVYPNQIKELAIKDVHKQYRLASKYLEQIPDYIEVIVTPGNHDAPRKALPQPAIANTFLETLQESRKVYSLGNPCTLSLHGVEILVFHGRSLDDVISTVPDMTYSHPEKAMRLLLQSRHLAPVYGGKTPLSPENRDPLVIQRVPDIFHAGHVHALEYANYRGVLIVNSGCWQEQTDYMRRNGFTPTPDKVPVVNLQSMEVTVIPFA
jgi:DNA polymerase II small subunit